MGERNVCTRTQKKRKIPDPKGKTKSLPKIEAEEERDDGALWVDMYEPTTEVSYHWYLSGNV